MTLATEAAAQISANAPQLCSTAPDAEMTVGKSPEGYYFGSRYSSGIVYSQDCNPYFTVDIALPGTFKVTGGFCPGNSIVIGGYLAPDLTESQCGHASLSVVIHRRSLALGNTSSWSLVEAKNVTGTWVPSLDLGLTPYCAVSVALTVTAPPSYATDQYRIMVQPKLYGNPVQAGVGWELP
jgi:hypothetical protein